MQPIPYVFFNGQAQDAIAHYSKVFDTQPSELMRMDTAPPGMEVPEDCKDWIMHCTLPVGDGFLYLSDDFTGTSPAMAGASVMLNLPTAATARPIFDALADGGKVRMPWAATSWSAGFGMLTDAFGIRWMVGCDEPPT